MEALLRWAAEAGITDSPSQPASSPPPPPDASSCLGRTLVVSDFPDAGGRGLAAARDLREGEMVLTVPRAALLTTDSVLRRDQRLASCVQRHPHLFPTQILTVCLLAEVGKGRGSQWYPYLLQLPQSYNTLATFSEFEIEAFQVEDARWASEKAVQQGKSDWKKAIILMQEIGLKSQRLTFRSWLWASATISSRTLHIPWDSAGCLCPVGDLFNYAAPSEEFSEDLKRVPASFHSDITSVTKDDINQLGTEQPDGYSRRLTDGGYEEDTGSYCFYARKSYKKGEQVLLGYGTYTNLELLEHYGFLLSTNPNDKAFIPLNAEIHISSSWPKDSVYIHPNGSPSFSLLCALRLWATPANLRRAIGHLAYTGSFLSYDNELFVMNLVVNHCCSILEKLPTTVEDDEQLLTFMVKMLDGTSSSAYRGSPSCEAEFTRFLRANGLQKGSISDIPLPTKAKMSLHRWRLAVLWRVSHKRILLSSISHCKQMINKLSAQHAPGKSKTRFEVIL